MFSVAENATVRLHEADTTKQPTMNHHKPTIRPHLARAPTASAASNGMVTHFSALPTIVQNMMAARGVPTPEGLRDTDAFMRFLERSLEPNTLQALRQPQDDLRQVLSAVKGDLSTRSAEALALHLYTKELLRLLGVAAARQYLEEARYR
jgi:hypothetical protein